MHIDPSNRLEHRQKATRNKLIVITLTILIFSIIAATPALPKDYMFLQQLTLMYLGITLLLTVLLCRNYPKMLSLCLLIALNYYPFILMEFTIQSQLCLLSLAIPAFAYLALGSGLTALLSLICQGTYLVLYKSPIKINFESGCIFYEEHDSDENKFFPIYISLLVLITLMVYVQHLLEYSHTKLLAQSKDSQMKRQKEFLYDISHEVRNPLNTILGNI